MLIVTTDSGYSHKFKATDYTEYTITSEFVVVKKDEQWVGIFDRNHFASLVVDDCDCEK